MMGPLGVTDQLLRSRAGTPGRRERSPDEWREQDGLLLALGAALLGEGKDSAAARQMLARIIGRGLLADLCRDLARTDAGAAGMAAHLAARLHPSASGTLRAAAVQPRRLTSEEELLLADWLRLAASAVGRVSSGSGDSKLRSSLALAWGRLAGIAEAGAAWLEDEDPRVRANAVESLWGRSDDQAVSIFMRKLADPHQRVAANSAVGLYTAGRAESVAALRNMAVHDDPAWRAAGVWAIGRTGDARFLPLLGELRRMKAAPVTLLRNVVLARERIRQVDELPRENVDLRIDGLPAEGVFRCAAHLLRELDEEPPPLRPTDFALFVNGHPVWEYRAWRSSLAGPDAFCLAAPGPEAEMAAQRAAAIVAEAGESMKGLFRLALGYDGGTAEQAKTGDILGLSSAPSGAWFAASPAAWEELIRRAARRLAEQSSRPCLVVAVERGCPEWIRHALPSSARESASLGLNFAVLHEPASLGAEVTAQLHDAGAQTAVTTADGFADALRVLLDSPRETWILEAPAVLAGTVRQVKLVLRSGRFRGEAERERDL